MKYVAGISYYPNCRACDSGYFSHLKFFDTIEELKNCMLDMSYEIHDIYLCSDGVPADIEVSYEFGSHSCIGIKISIKGILAWQLVDNGYGQKEWVENG